MLELLKSLKRESFTAPLTVLAAAALTALSGKVLDAVNPNGTEDLLLTYVILELLIFVLPGVFYAKCKPKDYTGRLHLISFGFSQLPFILLMTLVMATGATLVGLLYSHFDLQFDSSAAFWQDALILSEGELFESEKEVLYLSLTLAVVPAFAEEFLFRGVLLTEYSRYGVLPALLITSLLFAIIHFDPLLAPVYFLAGMALGYTAFATRSVFAAGVTHALFNLYSFFVSPLVSNFISLEGGTVAIYYVVIVLFLICLMLAFGEGERLFAGYSFSGLSAPRRIKKRFAALHPAFEAISPTLLLCILLFILVALRVIPPPNG